MRIKTIFSGLVLTTWCNDGLTEKYHWNHNEPKYGAWVLYDALYNESNTINKKRPESA